MILCPSHVANKWAREIGETLPDTAGVVVRSNTELDRLYELYEKGDKSIYAIISKEKARDGFMKQPAVIWNRQKTGVPLPGLPGGPSRRRSRRTASGTRARSTSFSSARRTAETTSAATACGSPLWAPVNPGHAGEWVKFGAYGWIHRRLAAEHLTKTKHEPTLEQIRTVAENPDGYYPTVGACRRYPMSAYIKRKYKGKLDGCIVDELHEYNNDSGQGDAMAEIFSAADRVIGMTATLINGYSSGIFHLLYRVCPGLMMQDGKRHSAPADFDAEYGVVENTYEEDEQIMPSTAGPTGGRREAGSCPGVSPLVYSRFLLEQTAFLSLSDMGKDLPDYEEIPIPLRYGRGGRRGVQAHREHLAGDPENRRKGRKALPLWPISTCSPSTRTSLTVQPPIVDPESGEPLVEPLDMGDFDTIGAKEQRGAGHRAR